ncbi:unnamed protein product, partial [Mesorhabditis belari]|uniref:Homeobox domain-containing protein n=1 Tax=Mesorhabditis belari TaxID=2138241 RepID=A0AAF3J5H0_9BILA
MPPKRKSKKPCTTGPPNSLLFLDNSMDPFMSQLSQMSTITPNEIAPPPFDILLSNHFFRPMFDVLCDRKNENALQPQEFTHFVEEIDKVDMMLEKYFHLAEQGGPCDAEDGASHSDIEEDYKMQMNQLRSAFEETRADMKKDCEAMKQKVCEVLEVQKSFRPISDEDKHKSMDLVERRFQKAEYQMKQVVCNQALVLSNSCLDARRKRRNFSKEATAVLQEFFNTHADHPYPTDEEKAELAKKCNITVQQVSNWFGNRRIRQKKLPQFRQYVTMLPAHQYLSDVPTTSSLHPLTGGIEIDSHLMPTTHLPSLNDQTYPSYLFDNVSDPTNSQLSGVYGSSMANLYHQ